MVQVITSFLFSAVAPQLVSWPICPSFCQIQEGKGDLGKAIQEVPVEICFWSSFWWLKTNRVETRDKDKLASLVVASAKVMEGLVCIVENGLINFIEHYQNAWV